MSDLTEWARREIGTGGWIRRMFAEGERQRREFGPDVVCDLSLGQPLEPPVGVREALAAAVAEDEPRRFGYMPNAGYPELRTLIAERAGLPGLTAAGVTVTGGAAPAVALALRCLVEPGSEVIGITPYFGEFRLWSEAVGLSFRAVPAAADLSLDAGALADALTPAAGAVIINSPCNPTGHVMSRDELGQLAEVLEAHRRRHGRSVLLISDEVYHQIVYSGRFASPMEYYEKTAVVRSFSKDLGLAGERIGYLALHPSLAGAEVEQAMAMAMRGLGYINAPATVQRALLALPAWTPDLETHRHRRDLMLAGLRAAGLEATPPDGGLYIWVRSPESDTVAYVMRLADHHLLTTPGAAFGDNEHLRICFSQPVEVLDRAVQILAGLTAPA